MQYRKPRAAITLGEEDSDEDSDVDHHVRELTKEMGKKYWDNDKIVRLLSLSYRSRTRSMASEKVCHLRITGTTSKFPCFKQPLYVSLWTHAEYPACLEYNTWHYMLSA